MRIDLNCDLGELEDGSDLEIMPFISSCNIACGAHAGSQELMEMAVEKAMDHDVVIGAHPGYPDKVNFGRISLSFSEKELEELILGQVMRLHDIAISKQSGIRYVKLHGALYHDASNNGIIASSVIRGIRRTGLPLAILGPPKTILEEMALENRIKYYHESFIDRRYYLNGRLVPRSEPIAVLVRLAEIEEQLLDIVLHSRVKTVSGAFINIKSDSICLHGDHPDAVENARLIRKILDQKGIEVRSFIN